MTISESISTFLSTHFQTMLLSNFRKQVYSLKQSCEFLRFDLSVGSYRVGIYHSHRHVLCMALEIIALQKTCLVPNVTK